MVHFQYVEEREGGYYITGARIALDSIVGAFKAGESPETILGSFPLAGPLVRLYGAITFYLENKDKVEAYLQDQERLWKEVTTPQPDRPESPRSGCEKPTRPLQGKLENPFLADANFNQRIVAGLLLREPEIDFALPQGVIPDGVSDPQILELGATLGRVILTHDVRTMHGWFQKFVAGRPSPMLILAASPERGFAATAR